MVGGTNGAALQQNRQKFKVSYLNKLPFLAFPPLSSREGVQVNYGAEVCVVRLSPPSSQYVSTADWSISLCLPSFSWCQIPDSDSV